MGAVTPADMAIAAAKADKSEAAARLLQEAGKGLMDAFTAARSNTVKLNTLAKLQVAQGYTTEAAVLLTEVVALSIEPERRLEVPGGDSPGG